MSRAIAIPLFALCGAGWGIIAWLFGRKAFGDAIWMGVLVSPLIGVAVGFLTQRRFEAATPGWRKVIALASLYAGVLLFGLALGVYDWWPGGVGQSLLGALGEGVGIALYGVTISAFFLLFWPIAYLTHVLLESAGRRVPRPLSSGSGNSP